MVINLESGEWGQCVSQSHSRQAGVFPVAPSIALLSIQSGSYAFNSV